MRQLKPVWLILTLLLISSGLTHAKEIKVLYIGNSYTHFNALPDQVAAMIESNGDDAQIKKQIKGGYSLEKHWGENTAQERILANEPWDYVVLQNHSRSTLDTRQSFDDYGKQYIDLIKSTGAQPVLYMTWARKNLPQDQATITEAYTALGEKNDALVAPVGLAFESWIADHPDIPLHVKDNSHPTMAGSYLAACVIYTTITGNSPIGLPAVIEGRNPKNKSGHLAKLEPELAKQLQETAWATVQAYQARQVVK